MDAFEQYFSSSLLQSIQTFVVAIIVLLIGWLIAKIIANGIEKGLRKTGITEKFFSKFSTSESKPDIDSSKIIAKVIYYILMVIVFIIFFNLLNLQIIAGPLADLISTFFDFIPAVLKAALILLVAFMVAYIAQWAIVTIGKKTGLGKLFVKLKVADTIEKAEEYVSTVAKVVFYVILLPAIPGVLNALGVTGIAEPFSSLLDKFIIFIPDLIYAAIVFAVGWFIAKIVKSIITNLLQTLGSEKLVEKLNLKTLFEGTSLASVVGNIVFVLIIIPVSISALEILDLAGITDPAISMLNQVMDMIPSIIIAVLLILLGIWLGKFLGTFVTDLLTRVGFNNISSNMKLGNKEVSSDKMTPSALVGYVVQVLIVFFLAIQALNLIKLDFLVDIASSVTAYLPNVLAAVLIIGIALILGNIVEKVVTNILSGPAVRLLAAFAKYAILVLAGFMALTQLGIATSIVASAFTLILGGLALAFGLAFGLGGKEFAQKYLKKADEAIEQTNSKSSDE
ncbi:MAG TPA: mechanosensitive ion channel [Pseudogracilibacillus sp.]|nr:mechanosensitive ion channel [Pseudogracilibacillus sp.]